MELNDDQRAAVVGALNNNFIFSITGSAGTGKSTVIREIYQALHNDGKRVAILAPTGRAANLLRTKIGHGETIHKFLNYTTRDDGETYHPTYCRENPILDVDTVIIDEASMVNREVWDNLLKALPDNVKLVLVGDHNQLPPIEKTEQKSAFNLCLEQKKYPKVELKQRYRFGKQAALSALSDNVLLGSYRDIVASGLAYRLDGVTDIKRLNQLASTEKYWTHNCQIISPTYRGVTGCDYINKLCQLHRWGDDAVWLTPTLCKGDKVITTVNTDDFYNGDLYDLVDITADQIVFVGKTVCRWFKPAKNKVIDLVNCVKPAYCITTHKSQGGEYSDVVYVLGKSSIPVANRANVYTGVTRSSENFVMLYDFFTLTRSLKVV
jgi:exodeoxyribonuclease V alpha subunit